MLYSRLPVVLLGASAVEKEGTAGYTVARFLLSHPHRASQMGIEELAQTCHVSLSSISRFCREIGLEDFSELHRLLGVQAEEGFEGFPESRTESGADEKTRAEDYCALAGRAIEETGKTIDLSAVRRLCREIHDYKKVYAFGPMKAETAAVCLQSDLLAAGKNIMTRVALEQQKAVLTQEDKDTLVILFSVSGSYFSYFTALPARLLDREKRPRIWMVCGAQPQQSREAVDCVLQYRTKLLRETHPYSLIAAAGILAGEYRAMFGASSLE